MTCNSLARSDRNLLILRVLRPITLVAVFLVMGMFAPHALAHDGTGIEIGFTAPQGIVYSEGESVVLTWEDGDAQAGALHRIYFQTHNSPPTHVPASKHLEGELIHEIDALDTTNSYTWELDDVGSGVYSVYAVTTDPTYCQHVEFAHLTVVVRKPGDPMPFGVMVTRPFDTNVLGMETAVLEVVAVGESAPTLNLSSGTMPFATEDEFEDDTLCDPFRRVWKDAYDLAEKVMLPDPQRGPGWWRLEVIWPMDDVLNDFYALRAQIKNEDGATAKAWSYNWVAAIFGTPPSEDVSEVTPDGDSSSDAGPQPSDDAAPGEPAVDSDEQSHPHDASGCGLGAQPFAGWAFGILVLWFLMRRVRLSISPMAEQK